MFIKNVVGCDGFNCARMPQAWCRSNGMVRLRASSGGSRGEFIRLWALVESWGWHHLFQPSTTLTRVHFYKQLLTFYFFTSLCCTLVCKIYLFLRYLDARFMTGYATTDSTPNSSSRLSLDSVHIFWFCIYHNNKTAIWIQICSKINGFCMVSGEDWQR